MDVVDNAELRQILADHGRYARFLKVDLHVHTPATPWCWNQKRGKDAPPAGSLDPEFVAKALVDSDLDIVAITDHDTVKWVSDVIKATRNLSRKRDRSITVLPGVEVTTYDGVHLLGLFPAEKQVDEIRDMLIRFGLKADGVKSESASSNWPVDKVAEEIERETGLVIAPHSLDPKLGVWGGANSKHKGRREFWAKKPVARIWACRPDQISTASEMLRVAAIANRPAFIAHSDIHSYDNLGANATYVKLAEPTLRGLRQVIHEPELRVAFAKPPQPKHPYLMALHLDGGYFKDETIVFSPHLNTLIGGNYAGKSAILDAIRYVFDDPCYEDESERQSLLERICGIFQDGIIRCWFLKEDGSLFRIDRPTVIQQTQRAGKKHFQATIVPVTTQLTGGLEIPEDRLPLEVLKVEMYGQGAVGTIAEFHDRHRDLIDNLCAIATAIAELDPQQSTTSSVLRPLVENADEMAAAEREALKLEKELLELPELLAEETKLSKRATDAVLSQWQEWQAAKRNVKKTSEHLDKVQAIIEESISGNGLLPSPPKVGRSKNKKLNALLEAVISKTKRVNEITVDHFQQAASALQTALQEARKAVENLDSAHTTQKKIVEDALSKAGQRSLKALQRRLDEIRERIADLEDRKALLAECQKRFAAYRQNRGALRTDLDARWEALRQKRHAMVDYLNGATGDELHVEYEPATDKTRLAELLDKTMELHSKRGAFVQRREPQIDLLIESFDGRELADYLLDDRQKELCDRAEITANTAEVLCKLPTEAKLALDMAVEDDRVTIKYRRQGEKEHTDLRRLSPGERALALLSVAFATRAAPLVIDQPEDELGQLLVTSELVDTIRRRKEDRQFIVVTHNANIPVLGDAECIVYVRNKTLEDGGRHCYVDEVGAIECPDVRDVLLSLEGGRESFERRKAKYDIA